MRGDMTFCRDAAAFSGAAGGVRSSFNFPMSRMRHHDESTVSNRRAVRRLHPLRRDFPMRLARGRCGLLVRVAARVAA
jgi:hypothetical protein